MAERLARRYLRIRLLSLPLAALLLVAGLLPESGAVAQERPRNIMEMLFGPPVERAQPRRQQVRPQAQPQRRKVIIRRQVRRQEAQPRRATRPQARQRRGEGSRSAARRAPAPPPAPVVPVIEKSENARDVLVVGDFLAASLARGLNDSLAENRDVRIVAKTNGSSGLVREDYYNWLTELPKLIEEVDPELVLVMIGSNDRQALGPHPVRSEEWTTEYVRRTEALAEIVEAADLPLVWVGAPAFQSQRMTEDMVFFNDLYRKAAMNVGGEFVDIWGGFVDANGAFTTSGPDPEGQPARLRNSDGITMAPAGQAKLAYYAEKPVIKLLGLSVDDMLVNLAPQQLPEGDLPARGRTVNAVSTPPMSFTDPALAGGETLLGGGSATATAGSDPSPRDKLVVSGLPAESAEGRADSFNWNGKGSAVSPATQQNAIVSRGSTNLDALRADPPAPPEPAADVLRGSQPAERPASVPDPDG